MSYKKLALLFFLALSLPAFCQPALKNRIEEIRSREYLPGDIVHIVVEAPLDTQQIIATMPDEQQVTLAYDGRNSVWHGYWEVPYGFKKGVYTAMLLATDVDGKSFEGQSAQFLVGEPILALMVQLAPSPGGKQPGKKIAPPTLPPKKLVAPVSPEVAAEVPLRVTTPVPPIEKYLAESKPVEIPAPTPPVVKKAKRPAQLRRRPVMVRRPEDKNLRIAKLMIAAKDYTAKQDYVRARRQLEALLKIAPKNTEVKLMKARLDVIIKAKGL